MPCQDGAALGGYKSNLTALSLPTLTEPRLTGALLFIASALLRAA